MLLIETTLLLAAECRPVVSASSSIKIEAAGSATAARERACTLARAKWVAAVKARYGARFTSWSAARDRLQALKVEGNAIKCAVQAKPCTPTVRAPSG